MQGASSRPGEQHLAGSYEAAEPEIGPTVRILSRQARVRAWGSERDKQTDTMKLPVGHPVTVTCSGICHGETCAVAWLACSFLNGKTYCLCTCHIGERQVVSTGMSLDLSSVIPERGRTALSIMTGVRPQVLPQKCWCAPQGSCFVAGCPCPGETTDIHDEFQGA